MKQEMVKILGSALEFKSEVKVGIDLFKNSNLVIVIVIFQTMIGEM